MKKTDIKKAGLYYTFGSFFNKGISFLTVPIFTRILSMEDYGIVSTYSAWVSIATVCIGMTLYMGIRAAFIDYLEEIDDFHSTVTIFISIVSVTILLICLAICLCFEINVLLPILCIIQSYANTLIEDYSMYLMMKYRFRMRTAFMVLPNLISVIISIFTIKLLGENQLYLGKIVPTALITLAFGMAVCFVVFRKSFCFEWRYLKFGLKVSLPLIVHGIGLTILGQSDRAMITQMVGADKTGIYSVVYNFSMVATALTSAMSGIWTPWYIERLKSHQKEDFERINGATTAYVNFMTMVMCGIILCAPEVLKFLATSPYWEGKYIIPPIVLANLVMFIYTFYVDVEHFHKKTVFIALNTMAAAVSNIALNYIFIPAFGYAAAAYTTVVSYVLSLVMHSIAAKKLEQDIFSIKHYGLNFFKIFFVTAIYYICLDISVIRWMVAFGWAAIMLVKLRRKYDY